MEEQPSLFAGKFVDLYGAPSYTISHMPTADETASAQHRSFGEVFRIFLRLGLTSFGGPMAHLGYFRGEFVVRRQWLDESAFADLVALCQFLPGPASSQVGFALGLSRGGLRGGLAAWLGFTLPSALALFLFALFAGSLNGPIAAAALHGLKIVAVAVVAQAVWGMARTLVSDVQRGVIAVGGALLAVFVPGSLAQIATILSGAILGMIFCRQAPAAPVGQLSFLISRRLGIAALAAFSAILFGLPFAAAKLHSHALVLFEAFYRSGALVFGGGHVVLPLLKAAIVDPGLVSANAFLSGYGAAQAVPGPLFTVSAYLGAVAEIPPNGLAGAAIALLGIFLPGMLILLGTLPFWDAFRKRVSAQALMRGVNAAVVGILAAALYNPVWTGAVYSARDFALALAGFLLLTFWKCPPWIVVAATAASAVALAMLA
jgi:chromate transporter